jgi:hypothetical protein
VRVRLRSVAVVLLGLAGVGCAAWWHENGSTLGDLPSQVHYHGCNYRYPGPTMTVAQAEAFEHQAIYYASTPFRELGRTPAGRPYYGLDIGSGDTNCSRSPLEIYVTVSNGNVQRYVRGGGP